MRVLVLQFAQNISWKLDLSKIVQVVLMMADSVVDRAPPVACVECVHARVLDDETPLRQTACSLAETIRNGVL